MKHFLELIKNPREFIQYIFKNLLAKLVELLEYTGNKMLRGLVNMFMNIFSLIKQHITYKNVLSDNPSTINKIPVLNKK